MQIDPIQNTFLLPQDPQPRINEPVISEKQIIPAVQALNRPEWIGDERELCFDADRETGRQLIRIVDRKTRRVLLQIPSETLLAIAEELERSGQLPALPKQPERSGQAE